MVDYFLGTAWKLADPATYRDVREILSGAAPDPATLRQIDWELAPFYCPADWRTDVLSGEGFYDRTMGTCPGGHKHMVDD